VVDVEGEAILRCSVYGDDVSGCLTFATWDAATVASVVLSGGDLHATNTGTTSANQGARVLDAAGRTSGKYYFEVTRGAVGAGNNTGFGIGTITSTYTGMGNSATTGSRVDMFGRIWTNGSNTGITLSALGTGQKCGVAVDLDNRMIWFRRSPTDLWNNSATANPSTNTGGVAIPAGTMVPFCTFGGTFGATAQDLTANFGLTAFGGLVPSGFTAGWCGAGG
jgi:hypothetical protein